MSSVDFRFQIISLDFDSSATEFAISELLSNKLLGLKISNFYSAEACQEIVKRCYEYGFFWINPKLGRIGGTIAQFHSHSDGKKYYFDLAPKVIEVRKWIFEKYKDPVVRIGNLLDFFYPCRLAFDKEYQQYYFPGMIQVQNKAGKVHVDRVSYESSDWSVADILSQFSCVLYLQLPKSGGELEFYERCWKPEDVEFEFSKDPKVRTGVNENLIEQCEKFNFSPEIGDLLIFNTNYYHRVLESSSEEFRMTSLSFFGVNRQSEIVFFM